MPNALARFLQERNISVERLQRKKILITTRNNPIEMQHLRSLVKDDEAKLMPEYIDQLDKHLKLTETERNDLQTMVKKKNRVS